MTASKAVATVSEYRALTIPEADLQQALDALREQEVSEFDLTRIKIPTGGNTTWEIPGARGTTETKKIEAVVIFSKFGRSYWDKPYTGGNEPPACASSDGRYATARPIPNPDGEGDITIPIPAERDDRGRYVCDTCSYAEFGTARRDGKLTRGQACKQMRQLFLLLPDRLLPAVLTLPPTSLKSAKTYFLGLVDEGIPTHGVITQVTLERTQNEGTPAFGVAKFVAGDMLSPEQAARAHMYAQSARPRFERTVANASDLPEDAR